MARIHRNEIDGSTGKYKARGKRRQYRAKVEKEYRDKALRKKS